MLLNDEALLDTIFSILFYITGATSVFSNCLLLYMIVISDKNRIKEYRILLSNTTVIDLLKSIMLTLVQPRLISFGTIYAYVVLGPIGQFGLTASYIAQQIALVMSVLSMLSLLLSFVYRYYVIKYGTVKKQKLLLICLAVDSVGIIQMVWALLTETDPSYINEQISLKIGFNFTNEIVVGNDLQQNPLALVLVIFVCLPIFPIYIIIIYLRKKIHTELQSMHFRKSRQTRAMHLRLMKVLTLQALVPPVFIFPPILIYFFRHLGIIKTAVVDYFIFFIVSITPSVNAILTLYCVKPYRDIILSMLGLRPFTDTELSSSNEPHKKLPMPTFLITRINEIFKTNSKNPQK